MKYTIPSKKTLLEIDGADRRCVYAPDLFAANRNIFPIHRHGRMYLEEHGIFRYNPAGKRVNAVRGGRYYIRLDQLCPILDAAPDGFEFPSSRDARPNHRKASSASEYLGRFDAIIERLDKLIEIFGVAPTVEQEAK